MKKQTGSTLIIVLVVLLLITVIGTIAVRSGILGLKISTNTQIQALLLENSNAAIFNIEDPSQVEKRFATNGMFSYFTLDENAGDQLVFCYKANQNSFFSLQNASVISPDGSLTRNGTAGYCKANWFASGRSAVLSQIYLTKLDQALDPLAHFSIGTTVGGAKVPTISQNISAMVISVLPSFSSATTDQIEACFKKDKQQVVACFKGLSIPYNVQYADYTVNSSPTLNTSS